MDSDESKLFIGGLAWDTTEEKLTDYFNQYGDVSQAVIMRDKITGRPRGFGFVVFSDPAVLDRVLNDKHTIDGRVVEAKKALSREEQQTSNRTGNFNATRSSGGGGNFKTKKIFVGGLPSTLTEDGFRQFFEEYGSVTDVVIMYDQNTQRPRGFGFITFDTEDAVDRVLQKNFHELNGKLVEVKRALPKDANPGGGGRGGGYQGYSASGASSNAFDGRMDGNRYMQPQSTAGGFPPYSGYGAAGYGYGGNTGVGYGGYGSYGVGGYGSATSGFGGPAGSYGNPNSPAGYVSGAPGALKNAWSSQSPSGYGASGGYAAAASWAAPGGSAPSAPRGQSPSAVSGYGNQGYGYGNYGGSYGSYPGVYGTSGGRGGSTPTGNSGGGEQQGTRGGYMGSAYGDTNGNAGYSNAAWRADPSQASGGYGSSQSRQT
ncbi:PREDICTED: heterogeneous nuclear ribonucleoprotein 1-like [Fragaria vesca subsp. vesca]|uniref:heterogeneous nuclear ribonucleoprotein 1-like n=1 Tax=Fragaria vesca subsp. vesca TaxID=101020 RepID=UPI0002C32BCD|nr:PREDICTED: heterogeneous nuclear ribonucleoprotein 1-like [Fragaria vesca subsp. vesca]